MAKRVTMMDRLMAEVVLCGGQLWTRRGLYNSLASEGGWTAEARRMADYTAFSPRTLAATPEEIAAREGTDLDMRNVRVKQDSACLAHAGQAVLVR